jgi:hypothetical protein
MGFIYDPLTEAKRILVIRFMSFTADSDMRAAHASHLPNGREAAAVDTGATTCASVGQVHGGSFTHLSSLRRDQQLLLLLLYGAGDRPVRSR